MKTCVISCGTIRSEVLAAMENVQCHFPTFFLVSGLHNHPELLRDKLQEQISLADDAHYERILLATGCCGNAINGLCSGQSELIVPRVDDCISLLLGSVSRRREISREAGTYFLTEGWLNGESSIWAEYQYAVSKYGERRAKSVMRAMLLHYKRLGIVDSGVDDLAALTQQTDIVAQTLGLSQEVFSGDLALLEQLFTGPWPKEKFLRLSPGESVTYQMLMQYY